MTTKIDTSRGTIEQFVRSARDWHLKNYPPGYQPTNGPFAYEVMEALAAERDQLRHKNDRLQRDLNEAVGALRTVIAVLDNAVIIRRPDPEWMVPIRVILAKHAKPEVKE